MPPQTIDLLDQLLTLAPDQRIKAADALKHPWLLNINPANILPPKLPHHQDCHEMWCKNQKRRRF